VRRAPASADSVDSRREEHDMDQDVDLLAQRVEKHRAKLDEEATLLDMTEKRVTAAESDERRPRGRQGHRNPVGPEGRRLQIDGYDLCIWNGTRGD